MVKKKRLEDDLDGGEAVCTIPFALNGIDYVIDLNATNAKDLRDAMEKYMRAAREVDGSAQDLSSYEAAYQVLSDRISDNFDLQWRGPTFALTAQSFLFLGFLAAMSYHTIQIILAALIFIVGVAASLLMARVQCLIKIDQTLLDEYGQNLIGRNSNLLLLHAANVRRRAAGVNYAIPKRTRLLLRLTPTPTGLWILTLLALSAAGIYLLVWVLHLQYKL
jgi:hypothetical protein